MISTRDLRWSWQGQDIVLGLDEAGDGPAVLLLPALSSISTRTEMHPLMQRLAAGFRVVAVDWPGFGTLRRPLLRWTPEALSAFLHDVLVMLGAPAAPPLVVAAGHAAAYLLHYAAAHAGAVARAALIAPTWRGPLPTMAGGDRPLLHKIRRAFEAPVIGAALYRLNVNDFVIRKMAGGHVYSDRSFLTASRLAEKRQVVAAPGARFASAGFVTGGLDRIGSREEFLALARRAGLPLLVVYGAQTPPRSRAEMEALTALPGVRAVCVPRGKLAVHEEFPEAVCGAIAAFLGAPGAGALR